MIKVIRVLALSFLCASVIYYFIPEDSKPSSSINEEYPQKQPIQTENTGTKNNFEDDCLYIPESSVPKGMSFGEYKKQLKQATGKKCAYYVGG